MLKLINGNIYDIYELMYENGKTILLIKIKSKDYSDIFLNYRTDLLRLYNEKYKESKNKLIIILDINIIKNKLFKMMKKEIQYFKENKELLEFIVKEIYIIKEKSILKAIYKLLSPFMFPSKTEIFIEKNLEKCLKKILD